MEVQLRHALKLESIGQLAAGIAHEINTPTQFIGDNARFLQEGFGDLTALLRQYEKLLASAKTEALLPKLVEETEAAVARADLDYLMAEIPKAVAQSLQGVERVTKIVRAMKDFSHPGTDEKTPVDLNKAIESTITVARNEWKYVAEMVAEFDSTLPPVPCLPGEFNQVILNLIVNAAHTIADVVGDGGKGKGTITVSTRRAANWAEIRIRDTGAGIPEKVRDRIFEPFFTTKGVGKGTGQGLAIARSVVVDKHGGTIAFETDTGRGTTFIIRLPMNPAVAAAKGKAA
jgi:signal transduction histidine kinase